MPDEVREKRQRLAKFIIPEAGIGNVPLPAALARLQKDWQTLPHETSEVPRAEFILDAEAGRQVELKDNPPFVSLPVPNVSLLAAQGDLKVKVTCNGAVLISVHPGPVPDSEAHGAKLPIFVKLARASLPDE